jgi:hypothetical protein
MSDSIQMKSIFARCAEVNSENETGETFRETEDVICGHCPEEYLNPEEFAKVRDKVTEFCSKDRENAGGCRACWYLEFEFGAKANQYGNHRN